MIDGSESSAGGRFGSWADDENGLPCFDLDFASSDGLVLPDGGPRHVWHLLGNDRMTALAHAGGWLTLYATAGGFIRLTGMGPDEGGGTWSLTEENGRVRASGRTDPCGARWGVGYAEWSFAPGSLQVMRRVRVLAGDFPALLVEVEVAGLDGPLLYSEAWTFDPYPLLVGPLMSRLPRCGSTPHDGVARRGLFAVSSVARSLTEALRRRIGARIGLEGHLVSEPQAAVVSGGARHSRRSIVPRLVDDVFITPLTKGWELESCRGKGGVRVALKAVTGPGHQTARLSFALGLAPHGEAATEIERVRDEALENSAAYDLPLIEVPRSAPLAREARWHIGYLRSAAVDDSGFSCRYVPQGSAYGFIHGGQGAPRDYAVTAAALPSADPALARDILRFMMRMTAPSGMVHYSHAGFGTCLPGMVHAAPTDLSLFLLWALDEYVSASGDIPFLDEKVPFYDRTGACSSSTVRERVILAWRYIRDVVGCGPHGLLRVGSGDWSDPISLMVEHPSAFKKRGESGFNTSMGAYVLPRAAGLVESSHPTEAEEMRLYAQHLREGMENAWTGRWFLRGWDGRGGPVGKDHLFLDGQVWCLIGRIGTDEQRAILIDEIEERCGAPSPIGHTILDRPHHVRLGILAPGEDCNGGVWAAINGLLAWGYALHDEELAWKCLQKQSLAAHARAYPRVWYGIWSGPDAYNSLDSSRPGETFLHPATPMTEFPVMNSNAHAGPLLGLRKVIESVEASKSPRPVGDREGEAGTVTV